MASWKLFCVIMVLGLASSVCLAQPLEAATARLAGRWEPERRLTRTAAESRTSINFARSVAADDRGGVHVVWREQATDASPVPQNGVIAFPGRDSQGRQQLFTINPDGSNRRQITFENNNSMPSWSPNGTRLVYVSRTPAPNLTIIDADGGNPRTLVVGDAPDWGPNDEVAYTAGEPAEIWVVSAAGGTPRQVTAGGFHGGRVHPSWSPDGTRLVYMQLTPQNPADDDTSHGCPALPFRAELWIVNADGTDPQLLTTPGSFNYDSSGQLINSADDANAPDWSAAGDAITFWSGQEQCFGQVWRINADGSGRTQLTHAPIPSHNDDPAWAPDGTKVLFTTDRNSRIETWIMDADGGNPHFLTESSPGPGPGDAAWQPVFASPEGPAVYYKRSPDGGVSWGPSVRLGPCPGPEQSGNPSIAVSGDTVHVAWWDQRTAPPQVWYKRSLDGGVTWEPEFAITNSPAPAAFPSIAAWGNDVHVVYVDQRDVNAEVYYVRSRDGGHTWGIPGRLSSTPRSSYTPTVAVSGGNVYVAWTDTRHTQSDNNLEEEYFRRSHDGGTTWWPEQRITVDPQGHPANSWAPSLAAVGSHVWITWFDDRGNAPGDFDIYIDHSPNFGATWTGNQRLTNAPGTSQRPVIASHDKALYITWWSTGDGSDRVHFIHSPNLGANWSEDTIVAKSPHLLMPGIAAAKSGVHVAWTDGRDGNAEVYYRRIAGVPIPVGNGRIAFSQGPLPGGEGAKQIFTMNPDGSDRRQLTFGGDNIYPAWSKDGTKLAFSTDRTGFHEIWTMNPDGSDARQVSHGGPGGALGAFVPDWSYDGTRIAYARVESTVGIPEVWVMNADGADARRLTTTPQAPSGPTWSLHPTWEPGDQRIYYASTAGGDSQIWGMFADGQGQHQKTNGLGAGYPQANAPQFSRDGTLTFWSGLETQYGEVWKVRFSPPPLGPVRLTETPDPMNSDNPAWSPDGTKILFDSNRAGSGGPVAIWIMNADGSGAQPLIPNTSGLGAWQPVFLH